MDAVTSKLEAMVLTNPDSKTTSGKNQAGCLHYRRSCAKKAKYNAYYYKKHQYSINRDKAVKCGNSRKQKLKATSVQKWNIKWVPDTGKYYCNFQLLESPSCVHRSFQACGTFET